MSREFESFVDAFVDYTSGLPSNTLWRKWAAIATIAGVLERKVWTYTVGSNHYPNQYIWLIGPPAAGKTVLTSVIAELWGAVKDLNIAPSSASAQSFVDALRAGEKRVVRPADFIKPVQYNAVAAAVNELSVFLGEYNNEMVAILTDLYDGKRFAERKRTSKLEYTIDAPVVNMIACGTPSYLGETLPEGAWDQGLMSRVILVYQGSTTRPELFSNRQRDEAFFNRLKKDLNDIANAYGLIMFSHEAKAAILEWYNAGGPPIPDHPKLESYCGRRTSKLLKLCQVACLEAGSELVVKIEHYQKALGWLLEVEESMPFIFKSISGGGQEKLIKDLWYITYKYFVKHKTGMPESMVFEFLVRSIPANQVKPLMEQLINTKIFDRQFDLKHDIHCWKPKAKAVE